MTSMPYFNSVTSESAFRTRFRAEHGRTFSELANVAASHWDRSHLLACRVVRRELQGNVLPTLSPYSESSDTKSPSDEIKAFLQGPNSTFMAQSEHYLVRQPGCSISLGQIWAAMAMFRGSLDRRAQNMSQNEERHQQEGDHDHDVEGRQKRPRRDTIQVDGYIDSSTIQVGSSSPAPTSSGPSSLGYVDHDSHIFAIQPEDETLRFASCVIRHILYYGPPQDSNHEPVVIEFRDAKRRLGVSTFRTGRKIVAIDDGGLCLRRQEPGRGFVVVEDNVAILETKTQFQCFENGEPIISDNCFAQMVCEALTARLSEMGKTSTKSIIVINTTQHYMCFLQFDMSREYVQDFENPEATDFLNVRSTPWFDLSQKSGREHVVTNICSLMRWAKSNHASRG